MVLRVRDGSERAHRCVALAHADDAVIAVGRSDLCNAAMRPHPHVRTHGRMHAGFNRTALEASIDSLRDNVGPYRVQLPEPSRCEKAVHALAASHALAHEPARPGALHAHSDMAIARRCTLLHRDRAHWTGHCAGASCSRYGQFIPLRRASAAGLHVWVLRVLA